MSNKKNITNPTTNSSTLKIEKFFGVILFLISFIFYWNAIPNETALDDVMVLTNNQFVLQGIDGVPDIYPTTQEAFIPQSLNMDLIDGVNFKKGCYTGQEIVARTHYLGKVKRRMYRGFIESQDVLTPGDQILNEKKEVIGQLVRSARENNSKTNMLIELRVDQAHEALYIKNYLIEINPEERKIFD